MTDQTLQALVETISVTSFHRPFLHQARFNARLRTTGGRFHLNDSHLDFNPRLFAAVDDETRAGIIKHELCHYHLAQAGRGYMHRDADFKRLLAAVGGLRYAPALAQASARYHYHCSHCGTNYARTRRINLRKYVCGRCHHRLAQDA